MSKLNQTKFPNTWTNSEIQKKWEFLKKLRSEVNNSIEDKRNEKIIGSSLESNVHIYLDKEYLPFLKNINF